MCVVKSRPEPVADDSQGNVVRGKDEIEIEIEDKSDIEIDSNDPPARRQPRASQIPDVNRRFVHIFLFLFLN